MSSSLSKVHKYVKQQDGSKMCEWCACEPSDNIGGCRDVSNKSGGLTSPAKRSLALLGVNATSPTTAIGALADLTLQTKQDALQTKEELKQTKQDALQTKEELKQTTKDALQTKEELKQTKQDALQTKEELNKQLEQTKQDVKNLESKHRYTTQSEADIGTRIVGDLESGKVEMLQPIEGTSVAGVTLSMVSPDSSVKGKREDQQVNAPMKNVCRTLVPGAYTVALTVHRSKLVDVKGREQRPDLLILLGQTQEWPNVVTMVVGKLDLQALQSWKVALGQACRRAHAILDSQPWRAFVVIPMTSLSEVAFMHMTQKPRQPSVSERLQCVSVDDDVVSIGAGCESLAAYLRDPAQLGFVQCPVQLSTESVMVLGVLSATTVCARSDKKCVFLLQRECDQIVLKAYSDHSAAEVEFDVLNALRDVHGIPTLVVTKMQTSPSLIPLMVTRGSETTECFAIAMSPYGQAVTSAIATPSLIRQYATILERANAVGFNNNDVSPDNLLVHYASGAGDEAEAVLVDWELASKPGTTIHYFSGKWLYACDAAFDQSGRASCLLDDLESLYYSTIAIVTPVGAVWGDSLFDRDAVVSKRRRYTGLGKLRPRFVDELPEHSLWRPYLCGIADALKQARELRRTDEEGAERVVMAAFNKGTEK